jgi:GntR family transcriptional regulator
MRLRVDPNSGTPLGVQIVRQIRLAVAAGRVEPGGRLPSARDLAATLGVNFHTVRAAYAELERDGLLRLEQGRGTFVSPDAKPLGKTGLRDLVRAHVERLVEDLAGLDHDVDALAAIVDAELRRALGLGRNRP